MSHHPCLHTVVLNICILYSRHRKSLRSSVVYGLTYGFSQGVLYVGYVITFRFGAFLVTRPPDHFLYTVFNNIFIVFLALVFGAMAAGQAGAFAPNYAKARLSANRIFALLNRIPETSTYCSEEGIAPVCYPWMSTYCLIYHHPLLIPRIHYPYRIH